MRVNFTPEDMTKGTLVDPGWHTAEITEAKEEPSKRDGSTNLVVKFKVLDGKFAGVILTRYFNEKAQGFMTNFLTALGVKVDPKNGYAGDLPTDKLAGKRMKIMVIRGEYKNKPKNEVDDFSPLGS